MGGGWVTVDNVPVLIFVHRLVSLGVINQHFKISLNCFKSILAAGKTILMNNVVKIAVTVTSLRSARETQWPMRPGFPPRHRHGLMAWGCVQVVFIVSHKPVPPSAGYFQLSSGFFGPTRGIL